MITVQRHQYDHNIYHWLRITIIICHTLCCKPLLNYPHTDLIVTCDVGHEYCYHLWVIQDMWLVVMVTPIYIILMTDLHKLMKQHVTCLESITIKTPISNLPSVGQCCQIFNS